MPAPVYGYANARIRGMKSRLLRPEFFDALLAITDLNELANAFEETPYAQDINEALLVKPGPRGIEEGLKNNLVREFKKILDRVVWGAPRDLVTLVLERFDVQNLRNIIRGKHVGASPEEIADTIMPAGMMDMSSYLELIGTVDVRGMIDVLFVWQNPFFEPLRRHYYQYTKDRNLAEYEFALERFYYEYALERLRGPLLARLIARDRNARLVARLFSREIDLVNIVTALRLLAEPIDEEIARQFFLPGGAVITAERFRALLAFEDAEQLVESLKDTPYFEALSRGLAQHLVLGLVSPLQRSLEKSMIAGAVELFKADPISIAPVIAYIWAKYNEVSNLRIVVRGKTVSMPPDQIREFLVVV